MKVLLNLMPIKSGGGQQVASNFIIQSLNNSDFTLFFLVTENTHVHKILIEKKCKNIYTVKEGLYNRLIFQLFRFSKVVLNNNIEIIYTMFGPGLHYRNIKSVTGCAYSNLFYPEIKFWQGYSFLQNIKLKLIDRYRLKSTLKSDFIIFENESMRNRAVDLFNYPAEQTELILPSISSYPTSKVSKKFRTRLNEIETNKFNLLMLSGWHKNKNIEIVPEILLSLKKQNVMDVSFVITVPPKDPNSILLLEKAKKYSVEKNIVFFDQVLPSEVPFLFEKIDGVALFSLLESFSNNIIESWYFKKPLFISDEEWSRSICENAAVYVERNDASNICDKIINYRSNINLQNQIKTNADLIIEKYPSPSKKVNMQLDLLRSIK
ncbi:glycosyltransferase family 4 protein [Polaribacter aestuariivivens]|uniref:Glycosyltransferase family 4 protein n=1 Tax=Polaribacter aestuariivivens TaxID=2304626 RepID=A0A5S3N254_9FLAO|nr:glycosyltransferase [Polaribacter aestuariivivens]TMM29147.1 glycosyltransferase family 4 protein [Polaribacter aestuariivivens]